MPTATDLVTDLPADFEVFGQAVATSMADLLGGTSGQILAKNSNTDMDFVWVANDVGDITAVTAGTGISGGGTSGAVTITNSMATEIAAKGDLIAGTGSQTFDNLTVGANNRLLMADSTATTGLKWGGIWAAYSPILTGITQGNGTLQARWIIIGKKVTVNFRFILGSTSAVTGDIYFSLPTAGLTFCGASGWTEDSSTGVVYNMTIPATTDTAYMRYTATNATYGTSATANSTVPFTWATGDQIICTITYEEA
jgi:hypothetical protein